LFIQRANCIIIYWPTSDIVDLIAQASRIIYNMAAVGIFPAAFLQSKVEEIQFLHSSNC
jgi:amino acid transporter